MSVMRFCGESRFERVVKQHIEAQAKGLNRGY